MKPRKVKTVHRCRDCGFETPGWRGRCPGCEAWQTLDEVAVTSGARSVGALAAAAAATVAAPPRRSKARSSAPATAPPPLQGEQLAERARALDVAFLGEVPAQDAAERIPTGLREVDRVLGGGLVPGAAALLAGDPGVGKSTLVLQLAYAVAAAGRRVLYVAGEESPSQLKLRAERLGFLPAAGERAPVLVQGAVELERVLEAFELAPDLVIVDSIQVLRGPLSDSAPGTVSQVRDVAHVLVQVARARRAALLLVGHVTKDGHVAGPKVVEHLVDQVLTLEGGDSRPGELAGSAVAASGSLRVLRAAKNRFGDASEAGVLEMTAQGLLDVENPSVTFLAGRARRLPGSCVFASREGSRSYLVELQALAAERAFSTPTRRVTGVDAARVAQVIAVLEKRAGLVFRDQDIFVSAAAGARVREPAADVAIAVACGSSLLGRPVPEDWVFFGELGLGGELRAVPGTRARLAEAARLGFRHAVIAAAPLESAPEDDTLSGLETCAVTRIEEVIEKVFR